MISSAAFVGLLVSELIGHRFKPDHHPNDPEAEITVRLAHLMVGLLILLALVGLFWAVSGEFPDRWPLLAAACIGPAVFEAAQYRRFGGRVSDKVKDTADFCAAPLACCLAIGWTGGGGFEGQILPLLLVGAVWAAWAAWGWWVRL